VYFANLFFAGSRFQSTDWAGASGDDLKSVTSSKNGTGKLFQVLKSCSVSIARGEVDSFVCGTVRLRQKKHADQMP